MIHIVKKIQSNFSRQASTFSHSISNWVIYGLKAGIAAGLTYQFCVLLDNPDKISSTFVSVICTTPTLLTGIKRGWPQILGSLIGGVISLVILLLGLKGALALGLGVSLAMLTTAFAGKNQAVLVSAFTALYLVSFGNAPEIRLWIRLESVSIGVVTAILVDILISSTAYKKIFNRRGEILFQSLNNLVSTECVKFGPYQFLQSNSIQVMEEVSDALKEKIFKSKNTKEILIETLELASSINRITLLMGGVITLKGSDSSWAKDFWKDLKIELLVDQSQRIRLEDTLALERKLREKILHVFKTEKI